MNYERIYAAEIPYMEQTASWKEGMKYLYSPDSYTLSRRQLTGMQKAGTYAGQFLDVTAPQSRFFEFRLDFVKDFSGKLWITEFQTDDRGLPAIATARNSRGLPEDGTFPGTVSAFSKSLAEASSRRDYSLVVVYPDQEYFYYAGFYDFARYCRSENPEAEFIISSDKNLSVKDKDVKIRIPYRGLYTVTRPDFIWDFTGSVISPNTIQPQITKQILLDAWSSDSPLANKLRQYIPPVYPASSINIRDKDSYILKPVSGRWSQGVVIGRSASSWEWQAASEKPDMLAQKFIPPPRDIFKVRTKSGDFVSRPLYSRIEGYYVKLSGSWILADVLATCTPVLPVHGMRDCIMIPAKMEGTDDQ